ncbi:acyltransferase [Kineosporia sp. J2-2]|uniref:Acyltransferase n=1 Tax=Kineosporia corallincola TaxID=2835133 RepID=A0ABS5TFF0_9ACTN|nr:acyltransferase [Kineosporia corallincola]MBT0769820.1 acyltransferase [Kineosporia corallincola]
MLRNVQALRGIAALAVVLAHISDPTGFENRWLAGEWNWTGFLHGPGQAGVDLFFVISGLIMVVTTNRLAAGDATARRFLMRRAVRIYPAYWLATAPILALFLVAPGMVNSSADDKPQVLASLFLLPQPGLPLLMVGWTLTFEMYFYLVFALILLLPARGRIPALVGWGVVTAALAGLFADSANPWLATVGAPIALEFLFGALVGGLIVRGRFVAPALFTLVGTAGAAAALAVDGFPGTWYRAVPVGLCMAVVVYGVVGLEQRRDRVAPAWLQALGDASYSMYLWHVLVLTALGRVVLVRLPADPVVHAAALLFSVLMVVITSIIAYRVLEKPLTALLRHPSLLMPAWTRVRARHAA